MGTYVQNIPGVSFETWLAAIMSSATIGFTSLVPWLFNMTFFETKRNNEEKGYKQNDSRMKYILSFAVGAILGDIFFHLIPESYQSHLGEPGGSQELVHMNVGLSVIGGIFMFTIMEMIIEKWAKPSDKIIDSIDLLKKENQIKCQLKTLVHLKDNKPLNTRQDLKQSPIEKNRLYYFDDNNNNNNNNNDNYNNLADGDCHLKDLRKAKVVAARKISSTSLIGVNIIDPAGYLNLIANGFDNFTHGLAIGASFLVGIKVGLLTTFVIIIHEIPHEICDYAILVNSGFSRLDAVKAQSSVSLFGLLGTAITLYVKSVDALNSKTLWILPFSAGGFLYIALVNLLPEILDRETNPRDALRQTACVILGIAFMAVVAFF